MGFIKKLFFLLILLACAAGYGFYSWMQQPLFENGPTIEFAIKPGSSVRASARQIRDAGVPVNPILLEALARVFGKANKMKAGSYEIEAGKTPQDLLNKIVNGEFSMASLAVIEGWTFQQMRKLVDAHPSIKHETVGLSEAELMRKISHEFSQAEGLFFPDTYRFAKGSSDVQLYQQAHTQLLKKLDEAWKKRQSDLPYKNRYEALTMASIIEKETGQKSERNMIAAVFINRLRTGMLLQTDPTVIYGMGERYQGKIFKRDLLTDTPYNTYTRAGLPPTPIALPGMESLAAAFNPARSDALYFVARGNGTSQFSNNLDEHNRAVNKYQR
ncbi:endolytic transglycosylase MltG [Undibacterium sp. Ji50W]|uniref:endolytic transglycosylase MltG n=1 Tax=Undibacterium sp. Ji50W TaxID=3413041 RepID=UPI003BF2D81D